MDGIYVYCVDNGCNLYLGKTIDNNIIAANDSYYCMDRYYEIKYLVNDLTLYNYNNITLDMLVDNNIGYYEPPKWCGNADLDGIKVYYRYRKE